MPRKRYDDWQDYEQGDYESRRSDLDDGDGTHDPGCPSRETLRWRWNAPTWIPVVGAWVIVYLLGNGGVGFNDVSPYASAVAGAIATLVWTWEERKTAAGMMKALIFGAVFTVVVSLFFGFTAGIAEEQARELAR